METTVAGETATGPAIPDRRQRFRSFFGRFNPSAPPQVAINDGLVLEHPSRSVSGKLATVADLDPGSQQLITGGIGSGKTTELLVAQRELAKHPGVIPIYVDVSAETDLSKVNSGSLLAALGLRLVDSLQTAFGSMKGLPEIRKALQEAAFGHTSTLWEPWPDEDPDEDPTDPNSEGGHYYTVRVPPILFPPFPAIERETTQLAQHIGWLSEAAKKRGAEVVAIFDGLDRLMDSDQFWSVAEQDLRALRPLGISVLTAGPLSVMYGTGRAVKDYFDETYHLPPAVADPRESSFLLDLLELRGAADLMTRDQMNRLCLASGGVLRDLISLARNSASGAYLENVDRVGDLHVERAIDQLGSGYRLGLGTKHLAILQKLISGGGFSPSDPLSMELLITRRVLEWPNHYEVHPALLPLLSGG